MTVQVVSFSGGRTSAYLVHLMEQRRAAGEDIRYVFMDTGAEHPKTYEFVRNVANHWAINLVCLRVVVTPELGKANSYRQIGLDEIGPDLQPWRDVCEKYGTPYVHGAFCTRTMKIEPFDRYCKDHFESFDKWLGIRIDEPRRLKEREGFHYLAAISDFEKQDVLDWWAAQPFDLGLAEHLGNCVFCIKKGINKVALATRDEPQMAADFMDVITSESVRVVERSQQENKIMYRGDNSLESIIGIFSEHSRDEIAATVRGMGGYDSGSCSESCEALSDEEDCATQADEVTPEPIHQYADTLSALRNKPAHKLKEVGDQWCTPDALFWGINAMFGPLVLDLFTDGQNSKCPAFYTVEDNALAQDWAARLSNLNGAAFANPPYSRASKHEGQYITGMSHIINHAFQMRELGGRYVFLIKAATSETWWPEGADHVSFIRGRIGFDSPSWFVPADKDQVPTGAFFAGAIVVFDKTWRGPAISYVSREQLLAQGEAFLEQIRWQAARLNNSTSEVAA